MKNASDLQQIGELVEKAIERSKIDMQGAMKRYSTKFKDTHLKK